MQIYVLKVEHKWHCLTDLDRKQVIPDGSRRSKQGQNLAS